MNNVLLTVNAASAESETSALDDRVYGALTAENRAFGDITVSVGAMDAKAVRSTLLRLQEAGKAELTYGLGWRRTGAGL